jgi:hypothetical protein
MPSVSVLGPFGANEYSVTTYVIQRGDALGYNISPRRGLGDYIFSNHVCYPEGYALG